MSTTSIYATVVNIQNIDLVLELLIFLFIKDQIQIFLYILNDYIIAVVDLVDIIETDLIQKRKQDQLDYLTTLVTITK